MRAPTRAPVICGLLLAVACDSTGDTGSSPGKDEPKVSAEHQKAVDGALAALSSVPNEARTQMVAIAVAEVAKDRLPTELVEALQQRSQAMPTHAPMLTMAALAEGKGKAALAKACDADLGTVVSRVSALPSPEQAKAYYEDCKFEAHGLLSARSASRAGPSALLLAHAVFVTLEEAGPLADGERSLLAALAYPDGGVTLTPGARKKAAETEARISEMKLPPANF